MKLKNFIFVIATVFWASSVCYSQSNSVNHKVAIEIPQVALLGLVSDGDNSINLGAVSPTEAGSPLNFSNAQDKSIWINYSSIVARNQHRKVVAMIEGEMPKGVHLRVEASPATGSGKGNKGEPTGSVELSSEPTDIIVNIGSCYTGRGINNGHYLTYKLNFENTNENLSQLTDELASVNVVYTLTDDN
ncbi:MAG: hypothetical protein J7L95_00625 [Prolixibacteraceae bacterium]|nr:hypothetical protein [Prolixibacteraceae bacterium]